MSFSSIEFSIPRIPPTINRLMRMHWTRRVAEHTAWTEEIKAALHYGKPLRWKLLQAWAQCGDRMRIEMTVVHQRDFDPDNLFSICKVPLDSLVALQCLKGDSSKHIELAVKQERGKPETKFKITRLTQNSERGQ
jgi:hypothetical protein